MSYDNVNNDILNENVGSLFKVVCTKREIDEDTLEQILNISVKIKLESLMDIRKMSGSEDEYYELLGKSILNSLKEFK